MRHLPSIASDFLLLVASVATFVAVQFAVLQLAEKAGAL